MNRNAVRRTLVECYDEALGDWRRRFEEKRAWESAFWSLFESAAINIKAGTLGNLQMLGFLIIAVLLQGFGVMWEFQEVFQRVFFFFFLSLADCLMAQMRSSLQLPSRNFDLQQPADFSGWGSDGLMCQQDLKLRGVPPPAVNSRPF